MTKPIIGIIPDYKTGGEGTYSRSPFYAVRQNYLKMIGDAGAAPILFGYDYSAIDEYLNLIDGLLFIGGGFDVNPGRYGEEIHPKVKLNEARDNFEFEMLTRTIKQKPEMPIFGICNGMQLINIFFGGSCIQHIPDHPQYINHEQSHNPEFLDYQPYHQVKIDKNSQLFNITKEEMATTNSSHHQAVGKLGTNIAASAWANDGIVEAIEHKKHPFCLGVQWHPEFNSSTVDKKIFTAFIKQCQK
ncbi:MAG: glutamine amidotransferase, class [Rickettsiaceae bacterium]|jgi:putative glutamine amidotransferase|nr:glutamine amidotransferase, class [Rickettsiaceae bacterium]